MTSSLLVLAIIAFTGGAPGPQTRVLKFTLQPTDSAPATANPTTECGLLVFHVDERHDPKFVVRAQPRNPDSKIGRKWSGPCTADSRTAPAQSDRADDLVRQLREFPAALGRPMRDDGSPEPVETRRQELYLQLRALGDGAMPTLTRGLADPDVQIRRNVALYLNVVSGGWYHELNPALDIRSSLPALTTALQDSDARVRGQAAQAIGNIGPNAAPAVPALTQLLQNSDEGLRDSACIALRGIGAAAKPALPALRKALSDPSPDVRRFAQRAIEKIDVKQ